MINTIAQLQTLLGERYAIERELGRGGTATVYLAREAKHERQVAVKVLRPDIGALLGAERFLAEIKLTSRLQHPHILPLYDSGEADGIIYYVMPYVEGESLRERMRRERRLPTADVVRMAREVADALAYAHARNIVHRDIKPENILLAGEHALVADFGIARAISRAGGENWEMVTSSGVVVGTPAYMSPEQAAGVRELDGRSDVYSLGCVVYEMLTGEPPFIGPDGELRLARRFTERAPSVRALRDAVPEHVDAAVGKALERDPVDRFARALDFAEALSGARVSTPRSRLGAWAKRRGRRLWLASGVLAAAAAVLAAWLSARRPSASHLAASVAVADTASRVERVEGTALQTPPPRDTVVKPQAGPEGRPATALKADSLARPVRTAALRARRWAADAGATAAELAAGDASLASAEAFARSGRSADAMLEVSSATAAWAEAERAARARVAASVQQQMQARAPAVSLPAPPAAQPAPSQPVPAVVDPRPAIETVLADYARAIGSRDLAEIRRVYSGLTVAQQRAWEQFFQSVRTVKASFSIAQLELADGAAEASVAGIYDYVDRRSGRAEHRPVSFRATFKRDGAAWRMSTVR